MRITFFNNQKTRPMRLYLFVGVMYCRDKDGNPADQWVAYTIKGTHDDAGADAALEEAMRLIEGDLEVLLPSSDGYTDHHFHIGRPSDAMLVRAARTIPNSDAY